MVPLYAAAFGLALGAALLAAVSLGLRHRRASEEGRAQIRWVVLGGLLVTVTFLVYGVVYGSRTPDARWTCSRSYS